MARTTALNKIEATLYEPTKYKIIQGGMSAGKTYAILTLLVGYCESYPRSIITVAGMTYRHLAKGPIRDLKKILEETGRWDEKRFNRSTNEYHFSNGSILEFLSLDNMGSRGPRRDVVFCNEANSMSYETFKQLAKRSSDFAIIDYNPSSEFWAHTEYVNHPKRSKNTSFLILTYKDNEALTKQQVEDIEEDMPAPGEEPSNWWTVYGMGQIGSLEGNVYSGWIETSKEELEKGKLVRYGLDFGFSNDESALVGIYDLGENKIGIEQIMFEKGILNSQYAEKFNVAQLNPSILIIADSARPEAIAEIKANGYRIVGADKNAGSVIRGINAVKEKQIYYYGDDLKKEYLSYAWRKKRSGEVLDEPQDGNDHLLDALRYAIDDLGHKPIQWAMPR